MVKNKNKILGIIVSLIFIFAGIVVYSNAQITTFEECENSWLVRSITIYDHFEDNHSAVEKACKLWGGMTFVKLRDRGEESGLKTKSQDNFTTPFFPTQKEPTTAYMQAELSDKPEELELIDGCFRVNNGYDNYLIVWSYGFSFSVNEEGVIQILDDTGHPIAKIGDKVTFSGGGGEMSGGDSGDISAYSEQLPSIRCSGPYWILGEIIKPKELNGNQKRAVEIATAHLSYPTTIVEVKELECYGCFSITLQRDDNQQQFTIALNDWKIANYK